MPNPWVEASRAQGLSRFFRGLIAEKLRQLEVGEKQEETQYQRGRLADLLGIEQRRMAESEAAGTSLREWRGHEMDVAGREAREKAERDEVVRAAIARMATWGMPAPGARPMGSAIEGLGRRLEEMPAGGPMGALFSGMGAGLRGVGTMARDFQVRPTMGQALATATQAGVPATSDLLERIVGMRPASVESPFARVEAQQQGANAYATDVFGVNGVAGLTPEWAAEQLYGVGYGELVDPAEQQIARAVAASARREASSPRTAPTENELRSKLTQERTAASRWGRDVEAAGSPARERERRVTTGGGPKPVTHTEQRMREKQARKTISDYEGLFAKKWVEVSQDVWRRTPATKRRRLKGMKFEVLRQKWERMSQSARNRARLNAEDAENVLKGMGKTSHFRFSGLSPGRSVAPGGGGAGDIDELAKEYGG